MTQQLTYAEIAAAERSNTKAVTDYLTRESAMTFRVPDEYLAAVGEAMLNNGTGTEDIFCFATFELNNGDTIIVTKYDSIDDAIKADAIAQATIAAPACYRHEDLIGFRCNNELAELCIKAYIHHGVECVDTLGA